MSIPICSDCKNFEAMGTFCVRGKRQTGVDPVYGYPIYRYKVLRLATDERESILPWRCGWVGRNFQAK